MKMKDEKTKKKKEVHHYRLVMVQVAPGFGTRRRGLSGTPGRAGKGWPPRMR